MQKFCMYKPYLTAVVEVVATTEQSLSLTTHQLRTYWWLAANNIPG